MSISFLPLVPFSPHIDDQSTDNLFIVRERIRAHLPITEVVLMDLLNEGFDDEIPDERYRGRPSLQGVGLPRQRIPAVTRKRMYEWI